MLFKLKFAFESPNQRYKVQLMSRHSCSNRVNFDENFSLILKMVPLHVMFSISTSLDLELHHLDIEIVFLHRELDKDIYMEQSTHVAYTQFLNYVSKLQNPYMV